MKRFEHGGNIYQLAEQLAIGSEQLIDFSANINPLVDVERLKQWSADGWRHVLHYPDPTYRRLRQHLADYHGVTSNQIVVDNGATPLIDAVVQQLQPQRAVVLAPTFGEYEKALIRVGATIDFVACRADYSFDVTAIECAAQSSEMLFICTPNNPTGLTIARSAIANIAEFAPNCLCVIDESFIDFCENPTSQSLIPVMGDLPNVVVLRSATKFYGMPGLRMGYLVVSSEQMAAQLTRSLTTWRVNVLAESVVCNALTDHQFAAASRRFIGEQRQHLKFDLDQMGFHVVDGRANYLLFKSPYVTDLYSALLEHNIVIRRCVNYRQLSAQHYRIAVKSAADNRQLILSLRQLLESYHD